MFLIVGAGKLAKHLIHYLNLLELPFSSWDRSQYPHLIHKKISDASHVLLAISDGAIESFYRKYLAGLDKKVVHFSGALNVEEVIAAHPLMSFGPDLYELETYRRIHFALTGAPDLAAALPGLPNAFALLAPEKKALYHAMCVMGGNFPVILWQKMFAEFAKLGIAPEAANVYLETVLANTLRDPASAFTGPLARKELATINKNLESLEGDAFQKIYLSFVEALL
ncbi:MAG: DUF2520 domain-containing protein [Bdellovibrionaceae bacterium]|nr:DUF2520 domain-containing protein [Pseudobdellovibrionaceae bacterium]